MERYTVSAGPDGQVIINDALTGRSMAVPAPKGMRPQSGAVQVAGNVPLASALVYSVAAAD